MVGVDYPIEEYSMLSSPVTFCTKPNPQPWLNSSMTTADGYDVDDTMSTATGTTTLTRDMTVQSPTEDLSKTGKAKEEEVEEEALAAAARAQEAAAAQVTFALPLCRKELFLSYLLLHQIHLAISVILFFLSCDWLLSSRLPALPLSSFVSRFLQLMNTRRVRLEMTVEVAEDDVADKSVLLKADQAEGKTSGSQETRTERLKTNVLEGEWDANDKAEEERMKAHREFVEEQKRQEALESASGASRIRKAKISIMQVGMSTVLGEGIGNHYV